MWKGLRTWSFNESNDMKGEIGNKWGKSKKEVLGGSCQKSVINTFHGEGPCRDWHTRSHPLHDGQYLILVFHISTLVSRHTGSWAYAGELPQAMEGKGLIKVYTTVHSAEDVNDHLWKLKCFEKDWIGSGWERWETELYLQKWFCQGAPTSGHRQTSLPHDRWPTKLLKLPYNVNFKNNFSGISYCSSAVVTTFRNCHPEESENKVLQLAAFNGNNPPHSCSVTAAVPSSALTWRTWSETGFSLSSLLPTMPSFCPSLFPLYKPAVKRHL